MNHEEYEKAANYWKEKDAENVVLGREALLSAIEEYITANDTCALATGTGDFVRCTPIEYTYHHGAFWMFTEGGEKFIALEHNHKVSIAIFDKYAGFGKLKGMQIAGEAEVIEPFSEEYVMAAEVKKIPLDAFRKLPRPMNLLKIRPLKIDFLNSDFKKLGCSNRQSYIF